MRSQLARTHLPATIVTAGPRAVDGGVWEALCEVASLHRLAGVVARAYATEQVMPPPPRSSLQRLRADARATATRALAALAPMHEAVRALEADGIPVLLWKGAALALDAWGDVGMRASADIDLVVDPRHRVRARTVVGALGWAPTHPMTRAQERAIQRGRGAWELHHPSHEVSLEVHWSFSALRYPGRLGVGEVLGRSRRLAVGGLEVRVPSAADTLVLLAQHGSKHGWGSLDDVAVFASLGTRHPDALGEARARARAVGGGRAWALAVALSERLLGISFSPEAADRGDRAAVGGLLGEVEARVRAGDVAWRPTLRWDLAWAARRRDRWRLLWRSLLDPTLQEWFAVRLPDPLVWLYPVLRPVRLVLRGRGG